VAGGATRDEAVQRVLAALLTSPPFLYKLELDPAPGSTAVHALTPWELASRLSYTLWATMPDERLFSLAADGSLARDDVYAAEVDRLLADSRADTLIDGFARPWLAGWMEVHQVDPKTFPTWNQQLASAMMEEFRLYVGEFLHGDRSFATFPAADFNFVNADLARHYGMPADGLGPELTRVEVTTDRRRGYLGMGAFLVPTSFSHRTSIPVRSLAVIRDLLCVDIPPPPPEVPILPEPGDPAPNPRTYFEQLAADPRCGACHKLFDPYGIALEELDAIGRFRTAYPDGRPIDAHVTLPDGTMVDGEAQLAEAVARDPRFVSCAARNALAYALGRAVRATDDRKLLQLAQAWAREGTTLRGLFRRIAMDDSFRYRRGKDHP
jgi:hypothetical protein